MGVGSGLYMCDVVVKSSRSLSHLLMSSCFSNVFGNSSADTEAYDEYLCKRNECIVNNFQSSYTVVDSINVELIERSVQKIKIWSSSWSR